MQELHTVRLQLKSAQQAKGDTEKKYNDLVEKYSKLSSEHEKLVSANKDLVQVTTETEWHWVTTPILYVFSGRMFLMF